MISATPSGFYLTLFAVGLLGGAHCLGMCGGVVSAFTLGLAPDARTHPAKLLRYQLGFNLGRIAGYGIAGALAGGLGALLIQFGPLLLMQRVLYGLAATMMILLGLYLGGWWRLVAQTERLGLWLWRRIEPLSRALLPVRSLRRAVLIGLLWAGLPCGLVYSALISALASANAGAGALAMLAFGLGTLPTLLGLGMLVGMAARIGERVWVRQLAGALTIGLGFYGLWQLMGIELLAPQA